MAKNELVPQSSDAVNNNAVKASDFPAVGGTGQGGKPGYNQLVAEAMSEESPRALESESEDGPSAWGKGGTAFKVAKNAGEGGPSSSMSARFGVDLVNGDISPNVTTERT